MNQRQIFLQHVAQTSPAPIALEITSAKGCYLYDAAGKEYLDLIGGISVCNIGHTHPDVVKAVQQQAAQYMHVMVYGETIQSPQTAYAKMLSDHLPEALSCVYFTNSGAEATEGALKLARRVTGRPNIISCNNSYHGNTLGALAVMGDEYWRNAFRPLMPGVSRFSYNSAALIEAIDEQTACVILETVQAEAGLIEPQVEWIKAVRQKCTETGALLILDEIQAGFGRTGKLWAFEHYGIVPDILMLAKALGGGMPLGAFISSWDNMQLLTDGPVLGHITTFGGHPVSCAAGAAAMRVLLEENLVAGVAQKANRFLEKLQHPSIVAVRNKGLLMAVELQDGEKVIATLGKALDKGVFSDWFLFAPNCIRLAPPLNITDEQIDTACSVLQECLDELA